MVLQKGKSVKKSSKESGAIRLITRGDDSGSCRSANRAIRQAFEEGILRNTSVIAPGPALADAFEVLGGLKGLCIGLHLTLTGEWEFPRFSPILPAGKVASLVRKDGTFPFTTKEFWEIKPDPAQAVAEARAQLDALRKAGFDPKYLDTHMGVGGYPPVQEGLADLIKKEGLIAGNHPPVGRLPQPEEKIDDPVDRLLWQLQRAEPGCYMAVGHPCFDDEDTASLRKPGESVGTQGKPRNRQRLMFCDPKILDLCRGRGIKPIRYDEI